MKNKYLYYIISFIWSFYFSVAIWSFFLTNYNNLSYSQAFFVLLLSWIVSFIFEIPSWSWCDRFWRKKMYLLWSTIAIFGLIIWTFTWNFYLFILSAIIKWLWFSMQSWNLEALIHDELVENNKEDEYKNIQANSYILLFISRFIWAIVWWYLYKINPTFPYLLTIFFAIIEILLVLLLKNPKQILSKAENNYIHTKEVIKHFKSNKNILYFIVILSLYSWFWNIFWFTYQIFYKDIWVSITTISIIFSITWLFSAIWSHLIKNIQNKFDSKQILLILYGFWVIWWSLFLFKNLELSILWIIINSILAWMIMPFWNNLLIKNSIDDKKSTILSVFSAFLTFSYAWLNIIIWFLLDKFWISVIYIFTNLIIFLLFFITYFKYNTLKNETNNLTLKPLKWI